MFVYNNLYHLRGYSIQRVVQFIQLQLGLAIYSSVSRVIRQNKFRTVISEVAYFEVNPVYPYIDNEGGFRFVKSELSKLFADLTKGIFVTLLEVVSDV